MLREVLGRVAEAKLPIRRELYVPNVNIYIHSLVLLIL